MNTSAAFLAASVLAVTAALAQDPLQQAWQMEMKGDPAGARDLLDRIIQTSPDNFNYAKSYAEMLERYRNPAAKEAYAKALDVMKRNGASASDQAAVERRIQALSTLAAPLAPLATPDQTETITIPGPLRSFARMAALSPDLKPEDLLSALARNIVTNGYQATSSTEALEQTEFLKLVIRYLGQAREIEKLSSQDKTIKIEQCESAQTGELLKILGYRMRGGCGAELVLETLNASRAFLTIDSGFPVANLEQALRTNQPFVYDFRPTKVPVLYGPDYWLTSGKEKSGEWIDTFLGDPSLCRMYLGVSKLDPITAAELKKGIPAGRLKAYSHVLDFFGGMFQMRNGKAVVPGGARSEKTWAEMAGSSPDQGAAFFDKLISKDDGWLASFYDALMRISGPVRDYLTEPDHLKRFYADVRGKVTSPGPARPVFRSNTDMMLLTTRLRLDPNGRPHIPGSLDVWKTLFATHPGGKYDAKLSKAAGGWKEPEDVLDALFGLSRKSVENEPLKIFMALSDVDRLRLKPLAAATVDRLARAYRSYGSQYTLVAEAPSLTDATILSFLETAESVSSIREPGLRADAAGSIQALLALWQILVRQGSIPEADSDKALATVLNQFTKIKSAREVFDGARDGLRGLVDLTTGGNKSLNMHDRVLDLLSGAGVSGDADAHRDVLEDVIRVFESQRLISLATIFDLDENLSSVTKGGKLNAALVKKLASRIAEVQLPRSALSSVEKNTLAFGYYTDKHIDAQRKLNLQSLIDKAGADPEKLKDVRGHLAPILRDTLVGLIYSYYAPPGAQILHTNPVFVRNHDFIGLQGANHTWKQTEVFGTGWPSSAGGRLVGSLAGLPYALAEAEQNFLVPTREQALIWGDLVPQMIVDATVPRWWNVTPAQIHWVGMHMAYAEALTADAVTNPERREAYLQLLDRQAPPARLKKVEAALMAGNARAALDQIVPAEMFGLANIAAATDQSDPIAAAIRRMSQGPDGVTMRAISRAFGTPKPTLATSYVPDLLQLRSFPTLMGYSSRIMAETWESNLLFYAALADEVSMPPAQLNVAVKDWTRQTVERIFATHLEDWPALLRSLRSVGEDVRERARKQLPLLQRSEGGSN
jgi:hypothetical protein